ncbi:hypothetical protein IWW42_002809 [Coemansia sp. RSA 1085]|nr:hypothetical protein IWW42_002809 [Coemansia sp. RSA 1085]
MKSIKMLDLHSFDVDFDALVALLKTFANLQHLRCRHIHLGNNYEDESPSIRHMAYNFTTQQLTAKTNKYVKTVSLFLSWTMVFSGRALSQLNQLCSPNVIFPRAKQLQVFFSAPYTRKVDSGQIAQAINAFTDRIQQLLPNTRNVQMTVYSFGFHASAKELANCNRVLNNLCTQVQTASFYGWGSPQSHGLQVHAHTGLTKLTYDWGIFGEESYNLFYTHSQTLEHLSIRSGGVLNYNRLMQTHSHAAIIYPHLLSLKIEIEGADFNNYQWKTPKRKVFFPQLRRFALNHVYPFSDDTIFRGNRETCIESIRITVDANSLEALASHGMFDKAKPCRNLKHLAITQEDESYLFDELGLPADMLQRWLSVAPALCSFSLLIDDPLLKQPLLACIQSSLPCNSTLQLLVIPHISLSLQDIMSLLSNLPTLTDLHCMSEGLGPELASFSVLSELASHISSLFTDIRQPVFKFWRAIVNDPDLVETSVAWPSVALALTCPSFSYTAVPPSQKAAYEDCLRQIMLSEDFKPHQDKLRNLLSLC